MAEWACGEVDWLDPPRMPRSHRRLRRSPSAPNSCGLRRLLQRTPNASVVGEGFAGPSADPPVWPDRSVADPRRTSSSILPDIVFSRDNRLLSANKRRHYWNGGILNLS